MSWMNISNDCLINIDGRNLDWEEMWELTILFNIGNRILAQARLLVNSVKNALVMITKRMTTSLGAPIIKRRNVAIVLDKSDAYRYISSIRNENKKNNQLRLE